MERRLDPEPITIYMAIAGTCAATAATVNLIKTHYKPLPSEVRNRLVELLTNLEDHIKRLVADLSIIEDIFRQAKFPKVKTIRLGNGA